MNTFDRKNKKAEWPAFVDLDKWKHQKPQIYVIKARCKECSFCISYCPEQILEVSDEINQKGYHPPQLKKGATFDECAECHFCELICPEFAIFVKKPELGENKA